MVSPLIFVLMLFIKSRPPDYQMKSQSFSRKQLRIAELHIPPSATQRANVSSQSPDQLSMHEARPSSMWIANSSPIPYRLLPLSAAMNP